MAPIHKKRIPVSRTSSFHTQSGYGTVSDMQPHHPNKAPHVLNASTNLVGFSFILLTSIKLFALARSGFISQLVAVVVVSFILCSFFSFLSLRSKSEKLTRRYETIADYIFVTALTLLLAVCLLLTFSY